MGGNLAYDNGVCNGIFIDRGGSRCVSFKNGTGSSTLIPSPKPSQPPASFASTIAVRGGVGYFNYDINDEEYGPINGWGKVENNAEFKRYQELERTLQRSLVNKCNWNTVNQSPIDLCENKINNDCKEYHQTRTHVSLNFVL